MQAHSKDDNSGEVGRNASFLLPALLGTVIGSGAVPFTVGKHVMDNIRGYEASPEAQETGRKLTAYLQNLVEDKKFKIVNKGKPGQDYFGVWRESSGKKIPTLNLPAFLQKGDIGVAAHEIGHAKGMLGPAYDTESTSGLNKFFSTLRDGSAISRPIVNMAAAAFAATAGAKGKTKLLLPVLGAAALVNAPNVMEEVRASELGRRLLDRMGAPGQESWRAYGGLPTYLASAAAPAASYGSARLLRTLAQLARGVFRK